MADEQHTVGLGIDASQARQGAAQYAAAIDKIVNSVKSLQKSMDSAASSMDQSSSFSKLAKSLGTLSSVRIDPSLARNLNSLNTALRNVKAPSSSSIKNTQSFIRALQGMTIGATVGKNLAAFTNAMSTFKGPSAVSVTQTGAFLRALQNARINPQVAGQVASVATAISGFKAPSAAAVRSFQQFVTALGQMKVPAGIAAIGPALASINARMASTRTGALRLGGSVNSIPWGRAGAGAIELTGNLRGLENAFSLSYQAGSQLRSLFGALTISSFTKGVYDSTIAMMRFQSVMGVVIKSPGQMATEMQFLNKVADNFGISLDTVYQEFGKFAAAATISGQSLQNVNYMFEQTAGAMRVMGLSAEQQQLVFLAMEQTFSKGTLSMEELKRQYGEQIPGAFELMQNAIREATGKSDANLSNMLKKGQVTSAGMVLLTEKLAEVFGPQFGAAAVRADSAVGRLQNSWTRFQQTVGQNGVVDAIGAVADKLSALMTTDQFNTLAKDMGEGLANAIRKVGDAAAWVVANAHQIGQVLLGIFAGKATSSILALGGALTGIGARMLMLGGALAGIGPMVGEVSALGAAFGLLGPIIGAATIAAGVGLAEMWNKTVQIGEATGTVGDIAQVVWSDFTHWAVQAASDSANALISGFEKMNEASQTWLKGINDSLGTQGTSWADWAISITSTVILVGQSTAQVISGVLQAAFQMATYIGKGIGDILGALVLKGKALADTLRLDFQDAYAETVKANDLLNDAAKNAVAAVGQPAATLLGTIANISTEAEAWKSGNDPFTLAMKGAASWMDGYSKHVQDSLDKLKKSKEDLENQKTPPAPYKPIAPKPTDIGTLLTDGTAGGTGAKNTVEKHLADVQKAVASYKAEIAGLDAELKSGAISQGQYNQMVDQFKSTLEQTADPYAALLRNLQQEHNYLTMSNQDAAVARELEKDKQDLLKKGIALTDQETNALKNLIEQNNRLQSSPFQNWINGIQDFATSLETVGVKAMDDFSSQIADLVVDGKADFASLFKSIMKDLVKLGLNQLWKQLFSPLGAKPTAVNAPLTGKAGSALDLSNSPSTPANNAAVMAQAVSQGIMMSKGGLGAVPTPTSASIADMGVPGIGSTASTPAGLGPRIAPTTTATSASVGDMMFGNTTPAAVTTPATSLQPWVVGGGAPGVNGSPGTWLGGGDFPGAIQHLDIATGKLSTASDTLNSGAGSLQKWLSGGLPGAGSTAGSMTKMSGSIAGLTSNAEVPLASAMSVQSSGPMLNLSRSDIENMSRVAGTEWDRRGGGSMDQLHGIIDTMMNRDMSPGNQYGQKGGMSGVLNKPWAFSDVTRKYGGNAANAPLNPYVQTQVEQYLQQRAGGAGSSVGNSTSYLNPSYASQASMKGWGNSIVGQAQQSGYAYGVSPNSMQYYGVAPGGTTPGAYGVGLPSGMGAPQPMNYSARPGFGSMMNSSGSIGGGVSALPGMSSASNGAMGSVTDMTGGGKGGAGSIQGLGASFKGQMESSFTQLSSKFPTDMEPGVKQVGQLLPQKLTQDNGLADKMKAQMQPATQQSAQNFTQQYEQANSQVAQDFATKMQSAGGGVGGAAGAGGGGGGIGSIMGLLGNFLDGGGLVGSDGRKGSRVSIGAWAGAPAMQFGGIVGDPSARPIIAHMGELVVPRHQVNAFRSAGSKLAMFDSAAVSSHSNRMSGGVETLKGSNLDNFSEDRHTFGGGVTHIWNITTPNADSFKRSQGQIEAKMGASSYRAARRNN